MQVLQVPWLGVGTHQNRCKREPRAIRRAGYAGNAIHKRAAETAHIPRVLRALIKGVTVTPYYQDEWVTIYHGDCREILPSLSEASAIVTDPPYELGFMGKSWDSKGISFQPDTWKVIRQACLSGSPLLSFGGSRTSHRIACAIEDAGWEIRDTLMWVYGQGFPKSLDISKAIDKSAGAEREVMGQDPARVGRLINQMEHSNETGTWQAGKRCVDITAPSTPEAQLWEGYGTGLKPAFEPVILAMNPLDGTFANNALKHGVAGLNIDGCRVECELIKTVQGQSTNQQSGLMYSGKDQRHLRIFENSKGRFPANFIHDGSQQVMELFPQTKSKWGKQGKHTNNKRFFGCSTAPNAGEDFIGDSGSAARFFYCAKASKDERNRGCDANNHPTIKPLALMEYLCKLVKYPEYNLIIDPFMGSGTTLLACINLGIPVIGIDSDESSCEIAAKRCSQSVMELNI